MKKLLRSGKFIWVTGSVLLLIVLAAGYDSSTAQARYYHTPAEQLYLPQIAQSLPFDTNSYFATSGVCAGCHGHDPQQYSLYTSWGEDVNIADDWAGTMMANASKDPLWRAKLDHETIMAPGLQHEIEDKCTSCHAPTGHFTLHYLGYPYYPIDTLPNDSFGLDGVNCTACHEQIDTLMGHNFTGNLQYAHKKEFGPYVDPYYQPMQYFIGFTPTYGQHVKESEFCAGCHTLFTASTDTFGNPNGNTFFEQVTFHEWKNSIYPGNGVTCQQCHIPEIHDSIHVATNYPFTEPRDTFGEHHLIGGNAFMLKLMRNNMTAVGATCQPYNFDTTIARTERNLLDNTLSMQLQETSRTTDTAFFDVTLTNQCGHKFPSGYPSRIAWVEFITTDAAGDTLLASGLYDTATANVIGRDPTYEPHHDMINNPNDVQIYEMVMGDVNHNVTTVLERADTVLKDNRLPPQGFSSSFADYDTVRIYGNAAGDPDFNYNGPNEGTGADVVHYHVYLNGYSGTLYTTCKVWYYSVPGQWLNEMFAHASTPIDNFRNLFNSADKSPELVAEQQVNDDISSVPGFDGHPGIVLFPNPSNDGHLLVTGWNRATLKDVRVFDLNGKEVMAAVPGNNFNGTLLLPRRGIYLVVLDTEKGKIVRKVVW